jgi:hypothetical protein
MARGLLGKEHRCLMRHQKGKALRQCDVVLVLGAAVDFRELLSRSKASKKFESQKACIAKKLY